ncbi:hypothetical protein PENSPDRAFT_679461 [Peniophora sp. CONT]|nr:hypothetical protein PENSPDRAFT_679461 [Peniophora sp. CONT]
MDYRMALSYDPEHSEGDLSEVVATSPPSSFIASPGQASRHAVPWKTLIFLFGALLISSAICVAHHFFLSAINGRNVEDLAISQSWIRDIGNALASIVQFLLQISVGAALTQSVWLYVRGNHVTLDDLNTLFSLPSISILPSTLLNGRVLYTIVLAAVLKGLALVGIFAPNALSVVPASPVDSSLRVPVPALDRIPATTSSYFLQSSSQCDDPAHCDPIYIYVNPSSKFQGLARGVLNGGVIFPWDPPSGCGRGCSYDIDYWGPALKCTDVPQSSIDVFNTNYTAFGLNDAVATVDPGIHVSNATHFLEGAFVYNATTSFGFGWPSPGSDPDSVSGQVTNPTFNPVPLFQSDPYGLPFSLDLVFATNNFTLPFTPKNAVHYNMTAYSCTFHNATYAASVKYSNGSQTTIARVVEYGAQLGPITAPESVNTSNLDGTDAEFQSTYATLSLASAMSQYVYGAIAFSSYPLYGELTELAPMFTSVFDSMFTTSAVFDGGSNTLVLSLVSTSYDNLARLLEDACTNLTVSLMSDTANLGLSAQVSAIVTPDYNVYMYEASRLWIPYGVALGVTLLVSVYGLLCIVKIGGAMEHNFSSIAASVRSRELDTLFNGPEEPLPAGVQKVKLRYRAARFAQGEDERAGFVIARHEDNDDVEMFEAPALKDEERS